MRNKGLIAALIVLIALVFFELGFLAGGICVSSNSYQQHQLAHRLNKQKI